MIRNLKRVIFSNGVDVVCAFLVIKVILHMNAQVVVTLDDIGEILGQQRVDSGGHPAHAIVERRAASALVRVEPHVKYGDDIAAEQGVEGGRLVLHLGHLAGCVAVGMTTVLVDLYRYDAIRPHPQRVGSSLLHAAARAPERHVVRRRGRMIDKAQQHGNHDLLDARRDRRVAPRTLEHSGPAARAGQRRREAHLAEAL